MRAHGLALLALGFALVPAPLAGQGESPFRPFDRGAFEAYLRSAGYDDARVEAFRTEADETTVAQAADGELRALFGDYDAAVTLAEDGDPRAALALTKVLAGAGEDQRLAAHSRYHLGRVFLDADDPEQAVEVFAHFLRQQRNLTPLDAEVMFFYGRALIEVPAATMAAEVLRSFLDFFPDAPERYVSAATQQLQELEEQVGPLHEIADVMKVCERRIRKTDTGKKTQERQEQVIETLQQILEEMIEQEKQSSGAASGLSKPNAPASQSALPGGATRIGNLNKKSGVADKWGNMKDRDREAIESDLRDNLPGHFKRMLEEYYRRLNTGRQ